MPKLVEMGTCPHHGLVVVFRVTDIARPEITTGPLCQTCYIEFFKESVTKVSDVRLIEVA